MADEKKIQCDCGCDCDHDHHDGCDCGHDHDCDCGCHDEQDVVMLQDENGNDLPFHYITTMEHEDKEYVFLQSAEPDEDDLIVEIFELQTVEEDGVMYDSLYPIEDDLYEILYNKLMQEIAADCGDEDCE